MNVSRAALAGWCAVLVLSCGDGGCGAGHHAPAEGVLLEGRPGDNALAAVTDLQAIPAGDAALLNGMFLTRIDAAIRPDATIGEVNAALRAVGGGIAAMRAGLPVMVVAVPQQPDAAGLESLAATLARQPGIRAAFPGRARRTGVAPSRAPANGEAALRHLNDSRFPAAWNVASLAAGCAEKPTVIVADYFTRPIPAGSGYEAFSTEVSGVDTNGTGGRDTRATGTFHGYDVLTTLAAALDDNVPTGANPFPGCLDIRTVQVAGLTGVGLVLELKHALSLTHASKVAVNTSLGALGCSEPCLPTALTAAPTFQLAFEAATLRSVLTRLPGRVLWATAAGNEAGSDLATVYGGAGRADYASEFAIAARADGDMTFALDESLWEPAGGACSGPGCFPSLTMTPAQAGVIADLLNDLGPGSRVPASDVLIVGSTVPRTNVVSAFSNPGADVTAVGEQVPTMALNAGQPFGVTQGTSFAAPQVAALASYLWTLSPDLRNAPASATRTCITDNVDGAARQVDAFASVLSLDPVGDPDPATWVVRRTLLDADGDGLFTDADIAAFVTRFFKAPALEEWVTPQDRDFSRFDLNGDGYTGGATSAPSFDLDRTGSARFGAPVLGKVEIQVGSERLGIEESQVTDVDVLCFYAYSALYQGNLAERDRLLANKCLEVSVTVSPVSPSVPVAKSLQFEAEVRGSSDPRVTWSLPGGGGTIDANGVFTAGAVAGTFEVRAASVAAPDRFGTASVTITESVAGVQKVVSRGLASVDFINLPFMGCQPLASPADATGWNDSVTCSSDDGLGNSGSATSTASFKETYVGDRLVEIVASGSSSTSVVGSGQATAVGSYSITFKVLEPVQFQIDAATNAPQFGQHTVQLMVTHTVLRPIQDTDGGPVNQTLMLAPGEYQLDIVAGPASNPNASGSANFDLHVRFGP